MKRSITSACRRGAVVAAGLLMTFTAGATAPPVGPDAPVLWSRQVTFHADDALVWGSPAATEDGGVIVSGESGRVTCLNLEDGTIRWTLGAGVIRKLDSPAVIGVGGVAVVGGAAGPTTAPSGRVIGIETLTGVVLWTVDLPGEVGCIAGGLDGSVLAVARPLPRELPTLTRIRVADGHREWSQPLTRALDRLGYGTSEGLAIGSGVAAILQAGSVLGVDSQSGAPLWETPLDTVGTVVVGPGRTFLCRMRSAEIGALDALTGELVWTSPMSPPGANIFPLAIRVTGAGSILALGAVPKLGDNRAAWPLPNHSGNVSNPTVVAWPTIGADLYGVRHMAFGEFPAHILTGAISLGGDDLLLGLYGPGINAFQLPLDERPSLDQKLIWSFAFPPRLLHPPTLTYDGHVVVSDTASVRLIAGDRPPPVRGWPLQRRDPGNSAADPGDLVGPPQILRDPVAPSVPAGDDLRISAVMIGERPLTVTWFRDGLPHATNQLTYLSQPEATTDLSGTYHFIAANALGSVTSAPVPAIVGHSLRVGVEGAGRVVDPNADRLLGNRIFPDRTEVRLRAVPDAGHSFIGWSDDPGLASPERVVLMDRAHDLRARFSPRPGDLRWFSPDRAWARRGLPLDMAMSGTDAVVVLSRLAGYEVMVNALDYQSGAERWSRSFTNDAYPASGRIIAGTNGMIYANTGSVIHALREETGEPVWSRPAAGRITALGRYLITPESVDGNLRLMALEPGTGEVVWRTWAVPSSDISRADLLIIDGTEVVLGGTQRLDIETGAGVSTGPVPGVRWEIPGPTGILIGLPPGPILQCLSWDRSRVLWSWPTRTANLAAGGGRLVVQDGFGVASVDPFTGAALLRIPDTSYHQAPLVAADGSVWVRNLAAIRCVDGTSGEIRGTAAMTDWYGDPLGFLNLRSLRMGADGTVIVSGHGVAAYHGSAPPPSGPWPQPYGNPRGSGEAGPAPPALSRPDDWRHPTGSPVTVRLHAASREPMTLRWERDGSPLPGETNAALVFPAFGHDHAGTYRLVASNAHGSTVTREFRLLAGDLPGRWAMTLDATAGSPLEARLESASDPAGPWTDLGPVILAEGTAPIALPGVGEADRRWYRLRGDFDPVLLPELKAHHSFGFPLPGLEPDTAHRVEYVDPSTGWESWQPVAELPAGAKGWHEDSNPDPVRPRFYRVVPLP